MSTRMHQCHECGKWLDDADGDSFELGVCADHITPPDAPGELYESLRALADAHGVHSVLFQLARVCSGKMMHATDDDTGMRWMKTADAIDKLTVRLAKTIPQR